MKNIFEKTKQPPTGKEDLNEIKRELQLINSKPTQEKEVSTPASKEELKEEIEKAVNKINEKIEFKKNPTEAETEEIVKKLNEEFGL